MYSAPMCRKEKYILWGSVMYRWREKTASNVTATLTFVFWRYLHVPVGISTSFQSKMLQLHMSLLPQPTDLDLSSFFFSQLPSLLFLLCLLLLALSQLILVFARELLKRKLAMRASHLFQHFQNGHGSVVELQDGHGCSNLNNISTQNCSFR